MVDTFTMHLSYWLVFYLLSVGSRGKRKLGLDTLGALPATPFPLRRLFAPRFPRRVSATEVLVAVICTVCKASISFH